MRRAFALLVGAALALLASAVPAAADETPAAPVVLRGSGAAIPPPPSRLAPVFPRPAGARPAVVRALPPPTEEQAEEIRARAGRFDVAPVAALRPAPAPSVPRAPLPDTGARTIALIHTVTRETVVSTYWAYGGYVAAEIARLSRFLADSRTGAAIMMDPALFDLLWELGVALQLDGPFEVLSGYRSPESNAALVSVNRMAARNSRHMDGTAIDVRAPGRSAWQVRQAALALGRGGVGYYARSGFVHLDVGPVRSW